MRVASDQKERVERVNYILGHESVYPHIIDDFSDKTQRYNLGDIFINLSGVYVLMPDECSLFIFTPLNGVLYHGHMQCLPEARGKEFLKSARLAIDYMFSKTPCLKIIGFTPTKNRGAILMALRVGFKKEGILTKSFLWGGELYDQVITGLSKE